MQLIIVDGEGDAAVVPLAEGEITIGRGEQNLVRLSEKDVSRRHGRIVREQGQVYVEDLDSFTGIRVNGEKVRGRRALQEGDKVHISAYELSLQLAAEEPLQPGPGPVLPRAPGPAVQPQAAPVAVAPRRKLGPVVAAGVVIALALAGLALRSGHRGNEELLESAASVAPDPPAPALAAAPAPASPEVNETEARRLLHEGNLKLLDQDAAGALPLFQQAISLKPLNPTLGGLYRSMGIAFTRQGDLEQGARYYRLYLPLCTDAREKAELLKLLHDYEARGR